MKDGSIYTYLGIELHIPDLGGRGLEGGEGGVGVDIKDADKAVEGGGGGDDAGGVGCDGYDAEAVAGVGADGDEVVGAPEPDRLVERAGEEEGGAGVGGGNPGHRPDRLVVGIWHGFQPCKLHLCLG